jgi:hypothetical protein
MNKTVMGINDNNERLAVKAKEGGEGKEEKREDKRSYGDCNAGTRDFRSLESMRDPCGYPPYYILYSLLSSPQALSCDLTEALVTQSTSLGSGQINWMADVLHEVTETHNSCTALYYASKVR